MAPITGKYQFVKEENFLEYLLAIGSPVDLAKQSVARKSNIEITVDGNKVFFKSDSGHTSNVIIGEEVEEKFRNVIFKSTTQLNGDSLIVKSIGTNNNVGSRLYEFSDSGLTLTLKSETHQKVAKISYKRI